MWQLGSKDNSASFSIHLELHKLIFKVIYELILHQQVIKLKIG